MSDDQTIDEQIRQRWGVEPRDGDIIEVDDKGKVVLFHRPPGPMDDHVSVPLVAYVDGQRVVVQEVALKVEDIHRVIGIPHVANDVIDYLFTNQNAEFALGRFFSVSTSKPSKD